MSKENIKMVNNFYLNTHNQEPLWLPNGMGGYKAYLKSELPKKYNNKNYIPAFGMGEFGYIKISEVENAV